MTEHLKFLTELAVVVSVVALAAFGPVSLVFTLPVVVVLALTTGWVMAGQE